MGMGWRKKKGIAGPSWAMLLASAALILLFIYTGAMTKRFLWWWWDDTATTLPPMDGIPERLCGQRGASPNFTQILLEYSRMHNEVMRQMADPSVPNHELAAHRFVVIHTGDWGIGNRFMGMTSSFVLALMTKRVFLVDWPELPVSIHEMLELPGFQWDYKVFRELQRKRNLALNETFVQLTHTGNHISSWRSFSAYEDFLLKDLNTDPAYGDYQVLSLKSNQYFVPLLTHNPHYKDELCSLFGQDVFGHLTRYLLQPQARLMDVIDHFKAKHGFGNKTIYGLQIRNLPGDWKWDALETNLWWRCAEFLSDKDTKWFISAADDSTKFNAISKFPNRVFYFDPAEDPAYEGLKGQQIALIDMWLLGEANEMMITAYSTFAYTAHGRVSKEPYVITHKSMCVKQVGTQPCFHRWYRLWEFPHLRQQLFTAEMVNQENCPFI